MVVLVDFKLFWRKNRHIVYKEIDYIRSKLTISENPVAIISLKLILEGDLSKKYNYYYFLFYDSFINLFIYIYDLLLLLGPTIKALITAVISYHLRKIYIYQPVFTTSLLFCRVSLWASIKSSPSNTSTLVTIPKITQ